MTEQVLYDQTECIATITLNRPARLNAWTPTMEQGVRDALERAATDASVRAIILTGAGTAFCAGADMDALEAAAGGVLPDARAAETLDDFGQRYTYLLAIPKPIIAAINGAAAGVGFALTLFCDLRYMVDGAKLAPVFSRRGLIAEHGSAWMLPRLVGTMAALDMLISGRVVTAEEARAIGLVRSLPAENFLEHVQAAARTLVEASSPRSIGVIKRQVHRSWMQSLGAAVSHAEAEQALSLRSADFAEGVAHFVERRAPRFTGH